MVKRTGEGGSPDEYFGSVNITLEQPAEQIVSMDGLAHVIALNEWQKISVMRVVPRVKYSLVPFWTRLVFLYGKISFFLAQKQIRRRKKWITVKL